MVGVLGGGLAHIRLPDGRHTILDGMSTAPAAARPGMFDEAAVAARANQVGPLAVGVPSALLGWCTALERYGTVSLADAMAPAIRIARARLHRHALSVRLHRRRRGRPARLPGPRPPAAAGRPAARRRQPVPPPHLRLHPAPDRAGGPGLALRRQPGRRPGQPHARPWRPGHPGRPRRRARDRARAHPRRLSRLERARAAAALVGRRARHPDAQPPGGLRPGRHGLRLAGRHPPAGRGAQDRLRRPRRRHRRSRPSCDVPVDRLTSKSYAAERRAGDRAMDRAQDFTPGIAAGRVRRHDAPHRRRRDFGNGRQPARRRSTACSAPASPSPGTGHDRRTTTCSTSARRIRATSLSVAARQARLHLHGADDRPERDGRVRLRARPPRRHCASSRSAMQALINLHRPRHDAAGSRRGPAHLHPGRHTLEARIRHPRRRHRRAVRPRSPRGARPRASPAA